MKGKITHNMGLKVFSVLIAVITWLVIINLADPTKSRSIKDIEVEVVNDSLDNYVYEVKEGHTVDVSLVGKKSVVDGIRKTDLRAFADLTNINEFDAVPIEVEFKRNIADAPEIVCNKMMKVSLEKIEEALFNIYATPEGTVDEDHHLGDYVAEPNAINARGGKSVIDRIDRIYVDVDVNGADKNFTTEVEPRAYDTAGRLVESNNLAFYVDGNQVDTVKVNVKILDKKEIEIRPVVTGVPASGYTHVRTEVVPESIVVAGTKNELSKIDFLELDVNIDGAVETYEQNVNNEELLNRLGDLDVRLVEEGEVVTVRALIEMEPMMTQPLEFNLVQKGFELRNNDGWQVAVVNQEAIYKMDLRGLRGAMENVTMDSVQLFVDLAEVTKPGRYEVKLQYELPEGVECVSDEYLVEIDASRRPTVD